MTVNPMAKRILVVNVNWLGDVIFSTPVFKNLKKHFPGAFVACLGVPRVREILSGCPYIDEIIDFDEKGRHWTPWGKVQLIRQLRQRSFDVAFLLHGSWTRAMLVALAGIPQRVGYPTNNRANFLTLPVTPPVQTLHRADHYLRVIESCGVAVTDRDCELTVDSGARTDVAAMLLHQGVTANDPIVVINAGGNWDLKRWPKENFAGLTRRLMSEEKMKVVLSGSPKDVGLVREIVHLSGVAPVVLTGQMNLRQLAALLQRASVVISNDSGPLHIASSAGTRVVALFGPTRPEVTGPRARSKSVVLQNDVGCNKAPCYFLQCPENVCMRSLSVADVVAAVRAIR